MKTGIYVSNKYYFNRIIEIVSVTDRLVQWTEDGEAQFWMDRHNAQCNIDEGFTYIGEV